MNDKEKKRIVEFREKLISCGLEKYLEDIVWMPDYMPMPGTHKEMFVSVYMGVKVCNLIDSPND